MKTFKLFTVLFIATLFFNSCSKDDTIFTPTIPTFPQVINDEEVITTMEVTLTPTPNSMGATVVTLKTQDLDGDGPNAPVVTVSGNLVNGVNYNGKIELLNETESPAENITEEVEEESDEHQFFYTFAGGLDAIATCTNFDDNNNNLGTEFTLTTNSASTGTLTFTLRHEPTKPNTGLADAGGETDIAATFNVTIQ